MALFRKTKTATENLSAEGKKNSAGGDARIPVNAIALLNCLTGDSYLLNRDSIHIGSDQGCDIVVSGYGILGSHCRITRTKPGARVERVVPEARITVDGNSENAMELLAEDRIFSLQIGAHHFFLIGLGREGVESLKRLNISRWIYVEKKTGEPDQAIGPLKLKEILQQPNIENLNRQKTILLLEGTLVGFRLAQFLGSNRTGAEHAFNGEFQCPRCWLRFDLTDMLYIAVDPSMRGDDVLGPDEMRRFRPIQFINGRPVDEKGVPCSETACPHCRMKLPYGFHELPIHIFSIVGIQSAGKSYYLALLVHNLKRFLVRHFSISLMDTDGGENQTLNEMTRKLVTASTASEAILRKTEPGGNTYRTFKRFGTEVSLPQPFVYSVRPQTTSDKSSLLIFYDNSGENFTPAHSEQAETTEHMAHCRTIFFLFDPVRHLEFHNKIKSVDDPQLAQAWREDKVNFIQDTVLGEMQRRMQVGANISAKTKSDKPFALVVGKYDLWEHLLPESELRTDFIVEGKLNIAAIDHNSSKLRKLMLEFATDIVGIAEAISEKVVYFPVSSFGSHAVRIDSRSEFLGPDPAELRPKFLEIPTVWALSRLIPESIPSI